MVSSSTFLFVIVSVVAFGGVPHISTAVPVNQVFLDVWPDVLPTAAGGTVTVKWQVTHPSANDTIGIFLGEGGEMIAWFPVTDMRGSAAEPGVACEGKMEVALSSVRDSWVFKYIAGEGQAVRAARAVRDGAGDFLPTQLHLAVGRSASEMTVMFVTKRPLAPPQVQYGRVPGRYSHTQGGTTHTYDITDLCEPHGQHKNSSWTPPGMIHVVRLSDLLPATQYFYRCGSDAGWSREESFLTPPAAGSRQPVRFLMYGDQGLSPQFCDGCRYDAPDDDGAGVRATWDAITQTPSTLGSGAPDFALHVGDLAYAQNHAWKWDFWFKMVEPIAARMPYMVSIGNHEYDYVTAGTHDPSLPSTPEEPTQGYHPPWGDMKDDSNGECGVVAMQRFRMPDTGNSLFWYSFEYGMIHVVLLSAEHDLADGSPQKRWLLQDLERVNRTVTPWLFVGVHRPVYSSANDPGYLVVTKHLRRELEDTLQRYNVDMVLSGHYHSYERTCPVYKEECRGDITNPQAPVHAVVGTAGIELALTEYIPVPWSFSSNSHTFGYATVDVHNATSLHWQFIATHPGAAPKVLDEMWLHTNHKFN
mmetsp:Transcript_16813/g.42935  ORF Transcript_16813/g.42935 Transcript_16813/m.42935 type:complete len:586 (+) Transcript_16813:285-2042(+)